MKPGDLVRYAPSAALWKAPYDPRDPDRNQRVKFGDLKLGEPEGRWRLALLIRSNVRPDGSNNSEWAMVLEGEKVGWIHVSWLKETT